MSSSWPKPSIGMVGEYQKSGTPFVTASNSAEVTTSAPIQISFPRVTRWVEVSTFATSGCSYLRIGFTENGIQNKGAVTGSVPVGAPVGGSPEFMVPKPTPSTYEKSATAKNWFAIPASAGSQSHRLEIACTDLFIMAGDGTSVGVSVMAGLTNIERDQLNLTGSQGYYGVG